MGDVGSTFLGAVFAFLFFSHPLGLKHFLYSLWLLRF